MAASTSDSYIQSGSGGRRQRPGRNAYAGKNRSGPVALVDIAIHGHGASDSVIPLHAADGHGHVVNHAEAFAVVGKGVMKSAADVDGDAIFQSTVGSQD